MGKTKLVASIGQIILLFVSLLVYASFGLTNFIFIVFSLITTYFSALYLTKHKNKIILSLILILNTGIFLFFKIVPNYSSLTFIAPLGLAYYTMQVIAYLIDIYKDKYGAETNLLKYSLYLFYFPCLFIGPINRYDNFQKAISKIKVTVNNIIFGLIRILWGLFKKLVIAGRLTILVNSLVNNSVGGAYSLAAVFCYSILLYADFSGGIDVVLGFSYMFGLNLPENFDRPYFKNSIKSFWQSWHMSLSNWLKDYIYIPLGGNRKSLIRTKINIILTFLVSGLWHGLNYLLWGLFHGLFVAFPNFLKTKWSWLNHIITIFMVSLLWVFFVYSDLFTALKMLGSIFTTFNYPTFFANIFNYGLNGANYIVLFISIFLLFFAESKTEKIKKYLSKSSIELKLIVIGLFVLIILLFGIYGIGFEVSEFIYSKF